VQDEEMNGRDEMKHYCDFYKPRKVRWESDTCTVPWRTIPWQMSCLSVCDIWRVMCNSWFLCFACPQVKKFA
jgi:hypothetical protein